MKDLENISNLISNVFEIPVLFFQVDGELIFGFNKSLTYNPLYTFQSSLFDKKVKDFSYEISFPRVRKTALFERYVLLSISRDNVFSGTLLIGPSLPKKITNEQLLVLIKDQNAFAIRHSVFNHYENLPQYTTKKLCDIAVLLHQMINNKTISSDIIQEDYLNSLREETEKNTNPNNTISQPAYISHDRSFEKKILKIVMNGEVEQLKKGSLMKDDEDHALYAKSSYLRSLKNHIISLVTLVSREAIKGGINSAQALELCDKYILLIEDATTIEELYKLSAEMLSTYTQLVRDNRTNSYSSIINKAIHFIYNNLYVDFQTTDIAEYVSVSQNYLSKLFKDETGMTLTNYIQKIRISEAKHLLTTTNTSVSEVSLYLTFSDQSYFTKIFKKHTGMTPHQYKINKP